MKPFTLPTAPVGPAMPSRWVSCAKWPKNTMLGQHDITTDVHNTKEQAEAVCGMLQHWGFGGQGIIFPLETWTEPSA